ncbi:hypothetical protein HDU67_006764, partial [Dinochytrium kinnereticum]
TPTPALILPPTRSSASATQISRHPAPASQPPQTSRAPTPVDTGIPLNRTLSPQTAARRGRRFGSICVCLATTRLARRTVPAGLATAWRATGLPARMPPAMIDKRVCPTTLLTRVSKPARLTVVATTSGVEAMANASRAGFSTLATRLPPLIPGFPWLRRPPAKPLYLTIPTSGGNIVFLTTYVSQSDWT